MNKYGFNFYKIFAILTLVSMAFTAKGVDLGAIELGKVYEIADFQSVTGTITPNASGTLLQDGVSDLLIEGLDREYKGYGQYGQVYAWQVEGGKTYTVACDFVFSGGKVCFYQESDPNFNLEVIELLPPPGSQLSGAINATGEILVKFNAEVSFTEANLFVGTATARLQNSSNEANTLAFNVATALKTFYDNGTLSTNGGDNIKFVVQGIQSSNGQAYNGNGILAVEYVSAPKQASLVSTNCYYGRKFKSYYTATDPEALLTYTFDTDIAPGCYVVISAGNPELDSYRYEEIRCTVDGKTVSASLADRLRNYSDILSDGDFVGVQLCNVKDVRGQWATSDVGSVGSFSYTFAYDFIEPFDVTSEFIPASGASLEGVNRIEIAFNHAESLTYGGVQLAWEENGITSMVRVLKSELETSVDDGWVTILLNKPAELEGKKAITITLYDLVGNDGFDHTSEIKAEYDKFVVKLLAPYHEGSVIATTGTEEWIVTCNAEPAYLRYDFYSHVTVDNQDGGSGGGQFYKAADGTYRAVNGNFTCYTDFTPYMLVRSYTTEEAYLADASDFIDSYKITFVGTTPGFRYSDVNFVSVRPAAGSTVTLPLADGFAFAVSFDGLVTLDPERTYFLDAEGAKHGFERIEAVVSSDDDPEGYSNQWLLYPGSESFSCTTSIEVCVAAFDQDGYLVQGNQGGNERDYLGFVYTIDNTGKIDAIVLDSSAIYDVYTIDGIHIGSRSIDSLPRGIYVVGGRKILR